MKLLRLDNHVALFLAIVFLFFGQNRCMAAESVLGGASPADLSQLRDITGIERHDAEAPEFAPWWPWLFVGVIPLAGGMFWLWRRRRHGRAALSPEDWAFGELARIEALRLPEVGALERFHTLLSDVLRRFLEMRFDLPASRQTTTEFIHAATTSTQLPSALRDLAAAFLEQCDLAKFARAEFSAEECQKTLILARKLVRPDEAHITIPTDPPVKASS